MSSHPVFEQLLAAPSEIAKACNVLCQCFVTDFNEFMLSHYRYVQDYRQYSLEWEHEKRVLQKQLDNLHSENKILIEKNETISKQLYNGANVELNFQLEQLQDQLAKAQDSITSQVLVGIFRLFFVDLSS